MDASPQEPDPTRNARWLAEQQSRLIGWECLQIALGNSHGPLSLEELTDRLNLPESSWYNLLRRVRLRLRAAVPRARRRPSHDSETEPLDAEEDN